MATSHALGSLLRTVLSACVTAKDDTLLNREHIAMIRMIFFISLFAFVGYSSYVTWVSTFMAEDFLKIKEPSVSPLTIYPYTPVYPV